MNGDHPDDWGLRSGNNKQPFKVVPPNQTSVEAVERAVQQTPEPTKYYTQVESIARRLKVLPYGDMKKMAQAVLPDPAPMPWTDLADRWHEWAVKTAPPEEDEQ